MNKKTTHKRITIYISEQLIQEIDKHAEAINRTRSQIIEKRLWDSIKADHDPTPY